MYCPECGVEYREGFVECADCHRQLVAGKPPVVEERGEPNLDVVTVLETGDPMVVAWAKGALEDAGIPYYVVGEERGPILAPVVMQSGPWGGTWCKIQVGRDREAEARSLRRGVDEL